MSETIIKGGTGNQKPVGVDDDNRILATAKSESTQEWISKNKGEAYQVTGETSLESGTVIAMHITNTSSDKRMIITYIRHQIVGATGGATLPDKDNYFRVGCCTTYASGGTPEIPANVHVGVNNLAEATVYVGNPTLAGTFVKFDKWRTQTDGDMNVYKKDGSLIIHPTNTLELAYVGDQTAGIVETRVSFVMEEI